MLGFGFALGGRRRKAFHPLSLFAGGAQGMWYDPSDPATLFEDSAGTVPASVGGPVARMLDKSGRGNHAVQSTAAARPILRQDGSGRRFLEFDGVDDRLSSTIAISLGHPWDRVSAVRQLSWINGGRLFGNGSGGALAGLLYQNQAVMGLTLYDGAAAAGNKGAAIGTTVVVTERRAGAQSQIVVNNGAPTSGNPSSGVANGVSIGADPGGGSPSNLAFYGLVTTKPPMSATQVAQARAWLAAKAGVAL